MRVLVADDEPLAREGLERCLAEMPEVEIVATCVNGLEAIEAIVDRRPDLALLDIRMPGMGGFEVIDALGADEMPAVIFVTAYEEYAVRAFDESAVDYVLKPITAERVVRAVERARRRLRDGDDVGGRVRDLEALFERLSPHRTLLRRFAVRGEDEIVFVPAEDVAWIESDRNYVVLHTAGGTHRLRATLSNLDERLGDAFVRIHRSRLVRTGRIRSLEPLGQGDYVVVLDTGARLTSSRSYRDNLRALLEGSAG
ncbi:MAG: LytR/AlgR family response regulator transcription factor [Gemmatimonadota bacterium]